MPQKRIAVTLPAGPRITDTIDRIRWAEDNGIPFLEGADVVAALGR